MNLIDAKVLQSAQSIEDSPPPSVAEVAFLAGQFSINDEKLDLKFENGILKAELEKKTKDYGVLNSGEEIERGIQKIKEGYNELQALLGSEQRIK